jgi:hypothetical protein
MLGMEKRKKSRDGLVMGKKRKNKIKTEKSRSPVDTFAYRV